MTMRRRSAFEDDVEQWSEDPAFREELAQEQSRIRAMRQTRSNRDELITALARLIEGLHVPISMSMPLGTASQAYSETRSRLDDFGWSSAEDIERKLRAVLDQ